MDLEELRAFVTLTEQGSLLEASNALGLARTTLRRRLEALQARIGVSLYTSTATGVEVTEAGHALVEHARRLLREVAAITSAVQEVARGPSGELRVVVPAGMPPHSAIPLYAGLRARFPGLSLRARVAENPLAASEDADLVVHFGARPAHGAWITKRLLTLRVWLVASRTYLATHGEPTSLDELAKHPIMVWNGLGDGNALPLLAGGQVSVRPAFESRDIHMLRQFAIAGLGLALVPDGMLPDPGFDKPPLTGVLTDLIGAEVALWTAIPEALRNAPRVRAMLASLIDVVPESSSPPKPTRET